MRIFATAIVDEKGGLARRDVVPFVCEEGTARFVELTHQHPIIVSARSAARVPWFDRRKLIRVSPSGNGNFKSIAQALKAAEAEGADKIFVAGGRTVLREAMAYAQRVVIHKVIGNFNCDSVLSSPTDHGFRLFSARPGRVGTNLIATETYLTERAYSSMMGRL